MNKMFIEILVIKQRLEDEITFKEQMIIEKELKNLSNEFIKEFRKNNIEQIKKYHEIKIEHKNFKKVCYSIY